jgi:hypothetical protein
MMNGLRQLDDQIVTNSYINSGNNYSLNDSNYLSIFSSECVERQLACDQWNKEFDFNHLNDSLVQNIHFNEHQFNNNSDNNFNLDINITTNSNVLINDSFNFDNNSDNYLNFNNNNNNNNSNNNNKQIVKKANNKLSTNKKISRKESSNSVVRHPKPVSAYALFFRDAQSVIKSSNPSATFGEISKVVASNWEQLDKYNKNIYKQRADQEKKNYLKSLASSRAKQIAGLMDQSSKLDLSCSSAQTSSNQTETDSDSTLNTQNNSTQQQSDDSLHGLQPNQHMDHNNEQQLQENIISESNSTAVAKQHCIRSGCDNDAIDSTEWDSEYCSSECCVKHCSDVFQAWVEKQQFANNNG